MMFIPKNFNISSFIVFSNVVFNDCSQYKLICCTSVSIRVSENKQEKISKDELILCGRFGPHSFEKLMSHIYFFFFPKYHIN